VCEVLPLTFLFCSELKMSHKSDSSPKEEADNSFFVLQAMQQQFERLNLVMKEVKDRRRRGTFITPLIFSFSLFFSFLIFPFLSS
jgi:hypothetical protein